MAWCWHRWPKWEQYEHKYGYLPAVPEEMWQIVKGDFSKLVVQRKRIRERRRCEKCGKAQDRIVTELYTNG